MDSNRAANLALFLVVLGWFFACYGALSQLGDPAPSVTQAELKTMHMQSMAMVFVGIFCLLGSLWLSGYLFQRARIRASLVAVAIAVPAAVLLYNMI